MPSTSRAAFTQPSGSAASTSTPTASAESSTASVDELSLSTGSSASFTQLQVACVIRVICTHALFYIHMGTMSPLPSCRATSRGLSQRDPIRVICSIYIYMYIYMFMFLYICIHGGCLFEVSFALQALPYIVSCDLIAFPLGTYVLDPLKRQNNPC